MEGIMNNGRRLVFVYGTLKKGQRNHYLMEDIRNGVSVFIANAKLTESFPLIRRQTGKKSPALLPHMPLDKSPNIVCGEVYEVDSVMLEVLDKLEDHPVTYIRRPIQCIITGQQTVDTLPLGHTITCDVYFFNKVEPEMYSYSYMEEYHDSCF